MLESIVEFALFVGGLAALIAIVGEVVVVHLLGFKNQSLFADRRKR